MGPMWAPWILLSGITSTWFSKTPLKLGLDGQLHPIENSEFNHLSLPYDSKRNPSSCAGCVCASSHLRRLTNGLFSVTHEVVGACPGRQRHTASVGRDNTKATALATNIDIFIFDGPLPGGYVDAIAAGWYIDPFVCGDIRADVAFGHRALNQDTCKAWRSEVRGHGSQEGRGSEVKCHAGASLSWTSWVAELLVNS